MRAGIPLTDADRAPWLEEIARQVRARHERGESLVVACSALRRAYREAILEGAGEAAIVYLRVPREVAAARLRSRTGHFMNPALAGSQFDALEPPSAPEPVLELDATLPPETLAAEVLRRLRLP
jgi:gluconokinase